MTTRPTPADCRVIVLALVRSHGAMSLHQLREASQLDKGDVARAVNAMQRTGLLRRIAPADDKPGVVGRYEVTGKVPRAPKMASLPSSSGADFSALLAAWGMRVPRLSPDAYPSRVIRIGHWDDDVKPDIPKFAPVTARLRRSACNA